MLSRTARRVAELARRLAALLRPWERERDASHAPEERPRRRTRLSGWLDGARRPRGESLQVFHAQPRGASAERVDVLGDIREQFNGKLRALANKRGRASR